MCGACITISRWATTAPAVASCSLAARPRTSGGRRASPCRWKISSSSASVPTCASFPARSLPDFEFFRGGLGNDVIDGGAGFDIADYGSASASVVVDLVGGSSSGADGADTLIGIEGISGGAFADTLLGAAGNDWLRGRAWSGAPATARADGEPGFEQLGWQISLQRWDEGALEAVRTLPPMIIVRARVELPS